VPINISYLWNFGSLLRISLFIQIISGLFLSFRYTSDINLAFNSVRLICRDINYGWIIRTIHANGASVFFFFIYIHIGRGIYYQSFKLIETWNIGVILFLISIGTAFLGYVLPWGQISFWGASVITNLLSAIPYFGNSLTQWIWGGFAVDNPTLTRFFSLHFILPFIISFLVIIHLLFLHNSGSNNPLGINRKYYKISIYPYFLFKDFIGFLIFFLILFYLIIFNPYYSGDPDNFIPANPLITPIHIQPEWYFLFAYAILRSIPNKLGGVIALLSSILVLFIIPLNKFRKFQTIQFYPLNKLLFWTLIFSIFILTWIGIRPVENPFIIIGQIFTILYFSIYLLSPLIFVIWDKLIK